MNSGKIQTKKAENIDTLLIETELKDLILWNDDVNTFDFVIETLIELCQHDAIQAEQCAILVHHKGKCAVKKGEYEILLPIHKTFLQRGLTSTIE